MMKEFFHSLVDKMIKDMAFGPVATCGFEVAEMEGAVGLALDGVVGRMYEGKDGIGGDAVDDVALFGRVGGVDHHAYIGGEVDIGDDALAVMEPDGHKELHIPAGVAHAVFVHFVEAVAPVLALKNAAAVLAQGTGKGAAGDGEKTQVEIVPRPTPRSPRAEIAVHHGEVVAFGVGTLLVDVHAADGHDGGVVGIALQQLLGVGEEIGMGHRIVFDDYAALHLREEPGKGIGGTGAAAKVMG